MTRSLLDTPIGTLEARFGDAGLKDLSLTTASIGRRGTSIREGGSDPRASDLRDHLSTYFCGRDPGLFMHPLDLSGLSEFRKTVYLELMYEGFGAFTTYGGLANRMGRPGAARAVGGAVRANPFLIIVPCHRVVASAGRGRFSLGGFGAGSDVKRYLLDLEGNGGLF